MDRETCKSEFKLGTLTHKIFQSEPNFTLRLKATSEPKLRAYAEDDQGKGSSNIHIILYSTTKQIHEDDLITLIRNDKD